MFIEQAKNTAATVLGVIPKLMLMICLSVGSGVALAATDISVFKSPNCGCCQKWVDHLETNGFQAQVTDTDRMNMIKHEHGIASQYQSCHTGVIDGYVFEGHVPAAVMQKFLKEKPEDAIGLAVPGMPMGSPGMEMGNRYDDYDVLLLKKDGSSEVYEHISAPVASSHDHNH